MSIYSSDSDWQSAKDTLDEIALDSLEGEQYGILWGTPWDTLNAIEAGDIRTHWLDVGIDIDFDWIFLQEGKSYEIGLITHDFRPEIFLFDNEGWLFNTSDPDDYSWLLPDDYTEDSITGFVAPYTGYYNIGMQPYYREDSGEIAVLAFSEDHYLGPVLEKDDAYLWDDTVYDSLGYHVTPADAQLYRVYMGALGRIPDQGGFSWWHDKIESGAHTLQSMAAGFIHSDEFLGYADANLDGGISNSEFVNHLYEGVFGRPADEGGFNWWMDRLDSGQSTQADVLVDMTQSNEYINLTLETVADYLFV